MMRRYSQKELICEANPFTWMAKTKVPGTGYPGPVRREVGKGLKRAASIATAPLRGAIKAKNMITPSGGKYSSKFQNIGKYDPKSDWYSHSWERGEERERQQGGVKVAPQAAKKAENQHKYINNQLLVKGLRSTKITGLPTVQPKKASGRFALVNQNGQPIAVFYPFTKRDTPGRSGNDIGFVVWKVDQQKFEIIRQPLGKTQFVNEPNFISLENSVSGIPHYLK